MKITTEACAYHVVAEGHTQEFEVRWIRQREGPPRWRISQFGLVDGPVLNREFEWEHNSLPSSRREDELNRTRYDSKEAAIRHIEEYVERTKNS